MSEDNPDETEHEGEPAKVAGQAASGPALGQVAKQASATLGAAAASSGAAAVGSALGSAYVFALGQAAGEPCVGDFECAAGNVCCDAVCVALASCEAVTTGEPTSGGTGEGPGSSSGGGVSTGSEGGLPEVRIDPRTEGCACATGGSAIGGAWLGLWALGWRRRRRSA